MAKMKFKGVILAGGLGNRLKPLTEYVPKALVPLAMQPLITFPVKKLKQAGILEVGIVVPAHQIDRFTSIIGDGSIYGMTFTYIPQPAPDGPIDALMCAMEYIGDSPVVVLECDTIFDGTIEPKVGTSQIYVKDVNEASVKFNTLKYSAMGNLAEVVEPSTTPPSNDAVLGVYVFTSGEVLADRLVDATTLPELLTSYITSDGLKIVRVEGYYADVNNMVDFHESQHWAAAKVMWE